MSVIFVTAKVAQAASTWSENWRIVNSPNMGSDNNQVTALSAVSTNDVWATGSFTIPGTQTSNGLIQHWDGSRWSIVPSPNPGSRSYFIKAVSAVSTNDVWAVGFTADKNGNNHRTLTEHWDGSQWSIVSSPNAGNQDNFLDGTVAVSTNNVWAVGLGINSSGGSTLILHWNGTQWSVVPSPNPGSTFYFQTEARAVSANDIWSVGAAVNNNGVFQTLIEHWNGTQWNIVPSPNVGSNNNFLNSVTTVSATDVWAVGTSSNKSNNDRTLTMHWNGSRWRIVPSPNVGTNGSLTDSLAAVSANDIWTVGFYNNSKNQQQNLVEHWNGTKWSVVRVPNTGAGGDGFNHIGIVSANDMWAVGNYVTGSGLAKNLIEHCC